MLPPSLVSADIPEPVRAVQRRLVEAGHEAYLVGGCVRDLLLGLHPKDFDVATSAHPVQVQKLFRRVIPTGIQHGTVTVVQGGRHVEVTTFRSEGDYVDGRRPSAVEFHTDIEVDLSRRDFTMNAIAFDPLAGELVDPFGGQADLSQRLIRCVGEAFARFSEDGLRPLRAVRFAAVKGFSLHADTEAAIPRTLHVFARVANERVREELVKLLLSDRPKLGMALLRSTGLLGACLAELAELAAAQPALFDTTLAALEGSEATLDVRLTLLFHGLADGPVPAAVRPILERLRFSNKETETTLHLLAHHRLEGLEGASDGQLRRFLAKLGTELLEPLLRVARALGSVSTPGHLSSTQVAALEARLVALAAAKPPLHPRALALDGKGIMQVLGVGPGPAIGEATRFVMERLFDQPELNSPEGLTGLLREWKSATGR